MVIEKIFMPVNYIRLGTYLIIRVKDNFIDVIREAINSDTIFLDDEGILKEIFSSKAGNDNPESITNLRYNSNLEALSKSVIYASKRVPVMPVALNVTYKKPYHNEYIPYEWVEPMLQELLDEHQRVVGKEKVYKVSAAWTKHPLFIDLSMDKGITEISTVNRIWLEGTLGPDQVLNCTNGTRIDPNYNQRLDWLFNADLSNIEIVYDMKIGLEVFDKYDLLKITPNTQILSVNGNTSDEVMKLLGINYNTIYCADSSRRIPYFNVVNNRAVNGDKEIFKSEENTENDTTKNPVKELN